MAHADLETVLGELLPAARELLAAGAFKSFAAAMNETGEVFSVAGEGVEALLASLREESRAGRLRAGGLCSDVRTTLPDTDAWSDALRFSLEHHTGEAVDVFLPYKKGWFGKVEYGEPFSAGRAAAMFA